MLGFGWRKEELRRRFYSSAFRGMHERFLEAIREHLRPDVDVLDAGCGSGRVFQHRLAGQARRVVGLDVTQDVRGNPNLDAAVRGDLDDLPLRDASFDLAILSHVAEHLTEPSAAFGELARVLRPGGRLLLLTPNRWHYVAVGARLTPHRLHEAFNRWRGVDEQDVFPTVYRANTAGRLRALLEGAGLEVERLERFETEPEYLAFHPLAYTLGVAYERLVNRFRALARLRVSIMAVARKPGTQA
jgi:SAM-dependent methyltransferase